MSRLRRQLDVKPLLACTQAVAKEMTVMAENRMVKLLLRGEKGPA